MLGSIFTQNALSQISFYSNQRYESFFLKQKKIDPNYLFYSHQSGTLETLLFLDESKKLALSSDRTYLVVLDESNIHQDTIRLNGTMRMVLPPIHAKNALYFVGLSSITKLEISNTNYQLEDLPRHKKSELAAPFIDGVIGPNRKSVKKQPLFPVFQYYQTKKPEDISQPLPFIEDAYRDQVVPSVYNTSFRYFETAEALLIFPVDTQQLIRVDKRTRKVSYLKLPYKAGEIICYYFYDHVRQQSYVVKHHFNSGFMELYTVDLQNKELTFLKPIPYFPEAIVNGGLYCRELDEEGSVSHFLIPIKNL